MSSICNDLRAAILQAAMQGKLTEQLPEDGSAEEILNNIELAKGKQNKRPKKLNPILDKEKPFVLPDNWRWARLGQVFEITAGGTPIRTSSEYWNGSIPWVKIGDMKGKYVNSTSEFITEEGLNNSSAKIFEEGTILYSVFASIGTVSILGIKATTNQAIAGLSKYTDDLDTNYMYWALVGLKAVLLGQARGMAQLNINQKILSNTIVPIPPFSEQKRIAEKIDELMARVADLEQSADTLASLKKAFPDDMKASLLRAAMQGKLTEQLTSDASVKKVLDANNILHDNEKGYPFDIPENWAWVKLKAVANVQYGFPFNSQLFNKNGKGMPLIRIRDILPAKTSTYTAEKAPENYLIKRNDMLVGMDGNFNVNFWSSDDAYLNQRCCKITTGGHLEQRLLYWFLPVFLDEIFENVSYTTVKHLSDRHLSKMSIPLPPLAEQKRIVERLDNLMQNINVVGELIASE